jgi:hypothetical protein
MPRYPIPAALKRLLVPAWNTAHHLGWIIYDHGSAIGHGRIEWCSVCGRFGPMLYRRRVIPRRLEEMWGLTPRLAVALARKESCECWQCGAKLRGRRMARVLLDLYPTGARPTPDRALVEWAARPEIQALRIAEINRIDGLHEILARLPNCACSDYQPGRQPGSLDGSGVRSEDLSRLTYADASFDLVLTSETLEHVPHLEAALHEIGRVLAPGGRHVFTIPQLPHVPKTFARSIALADGSIEPKAPRIAHPGGNTGYPVFTEFGGDLNQVFERAGFEFDVHFGPNRDDDLAQVYVCRKPSR